MQDPLAGYAAVYKLTDAFYRLLPCHMFYPAGVFFCILRLYTGQLKKLLEGLMTVSQLLPSGDPKEVS